MIKDGAHRRNRYTDSRCGLSCIRGCLSFNLHEKGNRTSTYSHDRVKNGSHIVDRIYKKGEVKHE